MNHIIHERIKAEIKKELKPFGIDFPHVFEKNILDLFLKVLSHELNDSSLQLDGLQSRVINSMNKIFLQDLPKPEIVSFFPDFAKIEPYLKKVLYLTNPSLFNTLSSQKKGLSAYINALNLNPNNIRFDTATQNSVASLPNFANELFRVYKLRNIESHNCEYWTQKEIYANIESVLVIYIYYLFAL